MKQEPIDRQQSAVRGSLSTRKSLRVWHTLEATGILALGGLAGCTSGDPQDADTVAATANKIPQTQPASEGPEGLEGAGEGAGEGEGGLVQALTDADDAAYLTQIGLIRGHLWVGHQLYLNDLPGMAATHMKHPKAELYSTLEQPFEDRGVEGFPEQLSRLANAVTTKAGTTEVDAAYSELKSAIARSEQGADTASAKVIGDVIVALLRTAGEEYALGVVDGRIAKLHEYQDALGFTQIAGQWARSSAFAQSPAATAVAARIQGIISELDVMWPGLDPQDPVPYQAARLYGAAARVEIEILGL